MFQGKAPDTDAFEMDIPEPAQPGKAITGDGIKTAASQRIPPAEVRREMPKHTEAYAYSRSGQHTSETQKKSVFACYSPENGLIDRVTVFNWHTDYSYYEQFRASALRLREYDAEPCAPVPFFSYMPQYSQMTGDQLRFYLYIRGEICEGRFPDAEYTYLLLLLYETLNLSDVNSPGYTMSVLCNLLTGYGKTHERLLLQLADWICDFSLISGVMPDPDVIAPFRSSLTAACYLKEFYIGLGKKGISASDILKYVSGYDYTKSRYARGENRAFYDRHINAVLDRIVSSCDGTSPLSASMLEKFYMTRDSYVGALCSPFVKKRMEITYFSFAKSHELRFLVTDILKYTENRLRQSLGIRSRLSHNPLPVKIKELADGYFRENLPLTGKEREEEPPAYEKLYEPAPSQLTPEAARRIEAESWETTEKLLEAFGGTDYEDRKNVGFAAQEENSGALLKNENQVPYDGQDKNHKAKDSGIGLTEKSAIDASGDDTGLCGSLSEIQKAFLRSALNPDGQTQKKIAKEAGLSVMLAADGINSIAADVFGDVILEEKDGMYAVIEDYYDEISAMLQ